MKTFCISLPEKKNLRIKLQNLENFFRNEFEWFDGVRLSKEDWKKLVINNSISPFYTGGRKDFKQLLGESGAWVAHRNLWKYISDNKIKKSFIVEDGSIFNEYNWDELPLTKQITFVNQEFYEQEGKLLGFGLNGYIITYKTSKKLLALTESIDMPLDLMIRKICNENLLTWEVRTPCICKDRTVVHSTSDELIDQDNNFSAKQDFRTLLERFFLNSTEVLNRARPKIAFCATYPLLGTGYAKVGYEFTKELCNHMDVIYLGFQNSDNNVNDRVIDNRIKVFDLAKLAPNSPGNFGFPAIPKILQDEKPDYLMIYNDCAIISHILNENKNFKGVKIAYLDILTKYHDFGNINFIKDNVDMTYTFTDHFKQHLIKDYKFDENKVGVINHGLRNMTIVENPREKFNISKEDFVVLNINRNSHRKRLETTIHAFMEFWKKTDFDPKVKLQLSCNMNQPDGLDILNFVNIMAVEYNKNFSELSASIMNTTHPARLPDHIIDTHYQVANVGITTSQGEGWGLSMFEMAYFGKHLISSDLPTHKEFLKQYDNIEYVESVGEIMENQGLKGLYPVFNYKDFADKLYNSYILWKANELVETDGKYIAELYSWENIVKTFCLDFL